MLQISLFLSRASVDHTTSGGPLVCLSVVAGGVGRRSVKPEAGPWSDLSFLMSASVRRDIVGTWGVHGTVAFRGFIHVSLGRTGGVPLALLGMGAVR